ncbi:uncharacterized protein C8R40DRAFT_1096057 [Lentinula edodes]|uniref:uncharacterized protein n=1 Tax=Lentinula edodes TaxID=5353 RepID=UPI001E8E7205|nr:uncharacterized protein C8R40DRAFT_1096057 [Lentinula edodes]KAH7876853.1 hypothetical protein C8R40DRAFT_1096057 [Lentinula edodes]
MSLQPTIFDRRSVRPAFELSRSLHSIAIPIEPHLGMAVNATTTLKKPTAGRPRRPTVTGFLPLPPISASPICTPTTGSSSREFFGSESEYSDSQSVWLSNDSYTTAPATPSEYSPTFRASPKWISTPPTPPPKLFKRSVTCVIKRPHSSFFPASSSFPAYMSPRASDQFIQRRNSVPAVATHTSSRSFSDLYPFVGGRKARWNKTSNTGIMASPLSSTFIPSGESTHPFVRSRPLFNVAHEVAMDHEIGPAFESRRFVSPLTTKPSMDPEINRHKLKDDIRRYHALMELLSTEVSYMQDLRILVSIYLRQIPTLTLKRSSSTSSTFGLNSSFSALSRANSSVHLSNITGHSSYIQPLTNAPSKEREKSPSRRIFKNPEIDVLTRNADEVLQFHEHFVEELRTAMAPLGIHMESSSEHSSDDEISVGNVETIDAGIAIVSTKFATEASRFTSYELFCAGHLEAIDVIRRVQNAHPTDWEAFEQKCSASAFEMLKSSDAVPVSISQLDSTSQSRRNSTATIDDAVRYVRSRSNSLVKDRDTSTPRNRSRLTFMDYLIKPVQRICKYPLLLEQLKSSEPLYESKIRVPWLSDRNVVVESAAQAMRHVASTVDEARQRQDVAVRSALIASRILYSHVLQSPSPSPLQVLTPGFLSSLGPCHIAGSLDVIHQRSIKQSTGTANINVKYLGAFLYRGGYFILAKVTKGRTYEPRHWFRLGDFKIIEAVESEAWLPCSFRLSCKGHEFEFAAACQQEREAWLTAIRESLAYPTSSWINEPTASILLDGKGEIVPSMLDDPYEAIVPLPTINSVPELASDTGDQLTETLLDALATESQMLQATATSSPEVPSIPSRRSSSTSAQAFSTPTSPEYETFVIRRNLPAARAQIDAGLSDVISDICLSARSQAATQEEELFQPPHIPRQSSSSHPAQNSKLNSRSSTSSSLSMAKNRLRKHESVRVPRRKSLAQLVDDQSITKNSASRAQSFTTRKRPQKLNLTSKGPEEADPLLSHPPNSSRSYSSPTFPGGSANSNPVSSDPSSTLASPVLESHPAQMNGAPHSEPGCNRSRPSSLVCNVRSLFAPRPPSLINTFTPVFTTSSPATFDFKHDKPSPKNVFRRWMGSVSRSHRRALSAPENSDNMNGNSPVLPEDLDFGEPIKLVQSPSPL